MCDVCGQASDDLDRLTIPYRENPFMNLLALPHFDGMACPSCRRSIDEAMVVAAMKRIEELRPEMSDTAEVVQETAGMQPRILRVLNRLLFDDFVAR